MMHPNRLLVAVAGFLLFALINASPVVTAVTADVKTSPETRQDKFSTLPLCTYNTDRGFCSFGSYAHPQHGVINLAIFHFDCRLIGWYENLGLDSNGNLRWDVISELPWSGVTEIRDHGYGVRFRYADQDYNLSGCGDLYRGYQNPICRLSFRC